MYDSTDDKQSRKAWEQRNTLLDESNYFVVREIANSPDLTPEQLRRFAMDEDPGIRLEVAMHSNTTADVLQLLSTKTEHKDVKRAVLTHPNTTDETNHRNDRR